MVKLNQVWIIAEKEEALAELAAGAARLGKSVCALGAGDRALLVKALSYGANKAYYAGDFENGKTILNYLPSLTAWAREKSPDLILVAASRDGSLLAGSLAAGLEAGVLTDVVSLEVEDGAVVAERMVYGGAAYRKERVGQDPCIVCVSSGLFEARPRGESQGEVEEIPFVEPAYQVRLVEKRAKEVQAVNLSAAKRVVAVGRGFAAKEDLQPAYDLAAAIQAEVGCSRPIAEGEGWLPREAYIGVSGVMLKPDLYIGLGISGQVQHMVGANQARLIVAVNKDKNAPIFQQADYGLVGDVQKVLPVLTRLFRG